MNANKRIAFNSVVIFIRLCIVSVVSLICSRVVLDALGESDYGLYNVVGGIVTLLNVINTSMVSTTYRYIAFELGIGKKGEINKVFNTSFSIHIFFSIFIIIAGLTVGDWYIIHYLNVAEGKIPCFSLHNSHLHHPSTFSRGSCGFREIFCHSCY